MFGVRAQSRFTFERSQPARRRIGLAQLDLALDIHTGLAGLAPLWQEIAATGARASVFQCYGWLETWARTAALSAGEEPLVVTGRDSMDRLQLLLPLGVMRLGPARQRVAGFLGQSHASYGLPLIAPGLLARITAADVRALFGEIARAAALDAVNLERQPMHWNGVVNPFAALGRVSANDSFVRALTPEFDDAFARLFSSRTRSTLRRKTRRIEALPGYTLARVDDADARRRLIETFLQAKSRQLTSAGIPDIFADPGLAAFYRALLDIPSVRGPALDVVALEAGGETGAVALLLEADGRRYLLNTALVSPVLRDASPGQILLTKDIAEASARGVSDYDFGPGAAAYKAAWQPETVPLLTTVLSLSAAGLPLAAALAAEVVARRTIKRTPILWKAAQSLRRGLFGGYSEPREGNS